MSSDAHEIKVMTSGTSTAAFLEADTATRGVDKEKNITAETSIGTGEMSIPNRLKHREEVDVIIVTDSVLSGFIKDSLVLGQELHPAGAAVGQHGRASWCSKTRHQLGRCAQVDVDVVAGQVDRILSQHQWSAFDPRTLSAPRHHQ